ncbi:MAG: ABC transporter permease [Candidatus Thermoplasmatota archaeon]|jgi:ABC-2 type transport system permease protein|nr:ABC transporter permease [Candidatus Thermoplasmatota archaeon]
MNPRRIWSVFLVNLRDFVRDKGGLFFTFLFPIILMLLFGFIFSESDNVTYDIYLQDMDQTPMSQNLTVSLKGVRAFEVHVVGPDRALDDLVEEEKAGFIIVIPEGYQERLEENLQGNISVPVNLTLHMDRSQSSSQVKYSILASVVGQLNKVLTNTTDVMGLSEGGTISPDDFEYIEFFIPGVIGLSVMSGAVFGTIFGDTELKKKGIFRKLSTTPITRGEWILSTMLFQLFLAAITAIVILVVGWIVFGARLHMNPIAALIIIFEAFAFTGLSMLVVRFVKDAQAAAALANAITFPMMFLSGSFFDVEAMPAFIQTIAKALPLYYVNQALREAMIFNDTISAASYMSVIAIFAVIVFLLGVKLTTWKQD